MTPTSESVRTSALDPRSERAVGAAGPMLSGIATPRRVAMLPVALESWAILLAVFVLGAALSTGMRLLSKRRYEARVVLATVGSQRLPGNLGSLAALSGLATQANGAPSPDMVASVLTSGRVLTEVGQTPTSRRGERLIDVLWEKARSHPGTMPPEAAEVVRRVLSVSVDQKTGLISVGAKLTDSAAARLLVQRIADVGGTAFAGVMRSQATAQRVGQEARVETEADQLRRAEERLVDFLRANRAIAPYSAAAVEQQSIQRDVQIAQQAYTDAVSAREAAYARELEQTPAVVSVDPIPAELPPVPRYTAFFSLAGGIVAAFVCLTILLVREWARALESQGTVAAERTLSALGRIPFAGRLLLRGSRA